MSIPLIQKIRVGAYILRQRLKGVDKYPLVLMLEPLFRCNLACAGCGKIDYEDEILNKRLSLRECLDAVDECGAPVVSIPGGEPLIHKDIVKIVEGIVARKKFVYLCTNALLLEKNLGPFRSISTAWRNTTITRCRKRAFSNAPFRPSAPPRPRISGSTSTARCSIR